MERTKSPQCVARGRGCAARGDRRHDRPPPAAQSGVTHRSFGLPPCEITPRAAFARSATRCAATGNGTNGTFAVDPKNSARTEHRAKRLSAEDRGDDSIAANLPPHFETEGLGRSKRPTKRRRVAMKGGRGER